jgi:hypothetical protein
MNSIQGDRQYLKYWREYLNNPEICSSKIPGKYCIEFRNFKASEFFNSLETCKKLMDCLYYPPSIIVKKDRDWDILELEEDEFYNCYPKYYGSVNASVCIGKRFIKNSKPIYPFLVQDRVDSKIEDDEQSVFILYVKKNNSISVYYAPTEFENNSCLLEALSNVQNFIIPKIDAKNYCEIEYLLTQFDVVEDKNNKFWIKGIKWDPNCEINYLKKIVDDIDNHIKTQKFNYFLEL